MTETEKWSAVQDTMPPRPPRLRIEGKVLAPSPGYTARLEPRTTQDAPSEELELELVLIPPDAPGPRGPDLDRGDGADGSGLGTRRSSAPS